MIVVFHVLHAAFLGSPISPILPHAVRRSCLHINTESVTGVRWTGPSRSRSNSVCQPGVSIVLFIIKRSLCKYLDGGPRTIVAAGLRSVYIRSRHVTLLYQWQADVIWRLKSYIRGWCKASNTWFVHRWTACCRPSDGQSGTVVPMGGLAI